MAAERLQKLLARAGLGSRRSCEDLIADGRVRLNARTATLGDKADPARDTVEVDGVRVDLRPDLVYLALHKPPGTVTTASDPQGRPTVLDLVPDSPRVFPVGRLDLDTSGLLLLTNDGDFANRVAHPRHEVSKTYVAEVDGRLARGAVARMRRGIELDDGVVPVERARVLASEGDRSLVEVVVHSGRKRMVRRLFDALDNPVRTLVRTAIGPVDLGDLEPGAWRELGRDEVFALLRAAQTGPAQREQQIGTDPP